MANAVAVLDRRARARRRRREDAIGQVFGRISFFLNAGIRFVEEICKCRAMTALWAEIGRERYGIDDEKMLRLRYGVQVNSLGLTEAQPENNIVRIALEALGVTLSKRRPHALAAAARLERGPRPAPALGSAALAAHPADPRLRDRSARVRGHLRRLARRRGANRANCSSDARAELQKVLDMGGAVAAVENAYMKQALVETHTAPPARHRDPASSRSSA